MSLIDASYFIGDLTIAGTERAAVAERLITFINKHEDQFLRDLLGYPMYAAFITGLAQPVVDQRWLDILQGTIYQYGGRTRQWRGLIILPPGQTITINPAGQQVLTAGGAGAYDPVTGLSVMTLPPAYIGVYFTIERRGIGQLRPDEFSIAGNSVSLINTPVWSAGETVILSKNPSIGVSGAGTIVMSPIANYVYWHWMEDDTTQTIGLGQQASKSENAVQVSPATKMVRAWNEMSDWLSELYKFMVVSQQIYPEWLQWNRDYSIFKKTNVFGI